jgi:hypothetical protein
MQPAIPIKIIHLQRANRVSLAFCDENFIKFSSSPFLYAGGLFSETPSTTSGVTTVNAPAYNQIHFSVYHHFSLVHQKMQLSFSIDML